jgi:manganese/iron transport system permease protein/iron/zinc/copper transport system permease protein
MDSLYTLFIEPLSQPFFQKALIGGTLVAIVCGVVGCFVILRRMAFLGDALSHAMLAGVTGGYLLMQFFYGDAANAPAMLIGSLLAALITVGMIGFISRVSRIKEDTAIGIMYTGVFAAGGILASVFSHRIHVDLLHFVMGQVLAVNDTDLWVAGIVAAVVLSAVLIFYRQLQVTSFDPVMAASIGIPVLAVDYLLTTCTSLVVVSAVTMVGVILVVGLLVTPAASAYLLCDRLSRMLVVSAALGATSVIGGLYVSLWCNIAGGAAIVAFCTVQFLVVLTIAPRYGLIAGWLRQARMVPQPLVEDVLSCVLRAGEISMTTEQVLAKVEARPEAVTKAIRSLTRQNLLEETNGALRLTEAGQREAQRVLRAHRLWEAYLEHVGTPETEIHARAHQLEHVHDAAAVDYIDDKLGHPLRDPHGKEIPYDAESVAPGKLVKVSQLREGHRGRVVTVGAEAESELLKPGVAVRLGPRQQNGNMWTVELADGRKIALQHAAADAVTVEVIAG